MQAFKISKSITDRSIESIGLYFKDVSKSKILSKEEEAKLYSEIKKGNKKAIEKLITANLRFVISVAKKYQGNGLSLVDLIQEGNLGLIKAAEVFDPDRGIKFISYAVWWIRQSIMKALSGQSRTIRLPLNQISCLSKVNKISEKKAELVISENLPLPYKCGIKFKNQATFNPIKYIIQDDCLQ